MRIKLLHSALFKRLINKGLSADIDPKEIISFYNVEWYLKYSFKIFESVQAIIILGVVEILYKKTKIVELGILVTILKIVLIGYIFSIIYKFVDRINIPKKWFLNYIIFLISWFITYYIYSILNKIAIYLN